MYKDIKKRFKKNYFIYSILGFFVSIHIIFMNNIFSELLLLSLLTILLILCYLDFIFCQYAKIIKPIKYIKQFRIQLSNFLLDFILTFSMAFILSIIFITIGSGNKIIIKEIYSTLLPPLTLIIIIAIFFGYYYWFIYWMGNTEDFNQWVKDREKEIVNNKNILKLPKKIFESIKLFRLKYFRHIIHISALITISASAYFSYDQFNIDKNKQEILKACELNESNSTEIICSQSKHRVIVK